MVRIGKARIYIVELGHLNIVRDKEAVNHKGLRIGTSWYATVPCRRYKLRIIIIDAAFNTLRKQINREGLRPSEIRAFLDPQDLSRIAGEVMVEVPSADTIIAFFVLREHVIEKLCHLRRAYGITSAVG